MLGVRDSLGSMLDKNQPRHGSPWLIRIFERSCSRTARKPPQKEPCARGRCKGIPGTFYEGVKKTRLGRLVDINAILLSRLLQVLRKLQKIGGAFSLSILTSLFASCSSFMAVALTVIRSNRITTRRHMCTSTDGPKYQLLAPIVTASPDQPMRTLPGRWRMRGKVAYRYWQ